MPKYKVLQKSFIGDRLVEVGEVVDYEGEMGSNLESLDKPTDKLAASEDGPMSRDELKAEALSLGLEFPSNIPTDKLASMVSEAIEKAQSNGA